MSITSEGLPDNAVKGIALTVVGMGLIGLNDAAMKSVVEAHPVGEAIFIRGLFATLPILFLVRRTGGVSSLKWSNGWAQVACAGVLAVTIFAFMFSLSQLPLSIATVIFFTYPIFVTLLAPSFLGEHVGWRRWSAVVIGFTGVVIVVQPGGQDFEWILLLPVGVAFLAAIRDLLVRR